MFGWLKKRIEDASTDSMKNDILRFNASLKGADAQEIATILVVANILRLNLTASGRIPPAALDFTIPRDDDLAMKCDMCPIALTGFIKEFQSMKQPTDALGVMVWLHSVRALNVPEIRIHGREMWSELSRGFPYVADTLESVRALSGKPLPMGIENEVTFLPRGLEPRE